MVNYYLMTGKPLKKDWLGTKIKGAKSKKKNDWWSRAGEGDPKA